jgi:hypothetical protein
MKAGEGDTMVVLALDGWVARWPLASADRNDLAAVDALARLALAARRAGADLRVVGPGGPLLHLVRLAGLGELLLGSVEVAGETEGLEEPVVEEAVVPDDPVA